jgi:hypothetical protein
MTFAGDSPAVHRAFPTSAPPYLPLDTVAEHLDAVEGLWLTRHLERFSTLRHGLLLEPWSRRLEAHIRALAHRSEDTVRETSLRLASIHRSRVFAAAYALFRVAPRACLEADGRIRLRSRHMAAVVEAMQRAPAFGRPPVIDPIADEADSPRAPAAEGRLIAHLLSLDPRAGLVAASRAKAVPSWARRRILKLAVAKPQARTYAHRNLALFAWGAIAARENGGCASPAFASLADGLLGDTIFHNDEGNASASGDSMPGVLVLALLGHAANARRIGRRIEQGGPSPVLLYALGLLGIPRHSTPLLLGLSARDPRARTEAVRALYFLTGEMFVAGDRPIRPDGSFLEPDLRRAEAYLSKWRHRSSLQRFHLGQSLALDIGGAPPSFQYLRAIQSGQPLHLAAEHLPGLFDGRPRTFAPAFSILPSNVWTTSEPPPVMPEPRGPQGAL